MAEEVRSATLVVAPLRLGSGTRIKILEAFAHRVPVVATSVGAAGLTVKDREHLLIADDPESFARACLELLDNSALRSRLAANALTLLRREYLWMGIRDRVKALALNAVMPVH